MYSFKIRCKVLCEVFTMNPEEMRQFYWYEPDFKLKPSI